MPSSVIAIGRGVGICADHSCIGDDVAKGIIDKGGVAALVSYGRQVSHPVIPASRGIIGVGYIFG